MDKFWQRNHHRTHRACSCFRKVVINKLKLTGYLEVDIKQVPIQKNVRYSISGLNTGYESSPSSPAVVTKVLGAIFNPADFLYNIFGKKPREMRKLRKMKKQDEIRTILASRFDREMLTALLQVDKVVGLAENWRM